MMARHWPLIALAVCLGAPWSCSFADTGEGSGTLSVNGELDCSFASQSTAVTFNVMEGSAAVEDANVTLQDGDSHESVHVPFDAALGQYSVQWPGYHRHVTVQIWRGADGLMARLEGPARHTVVHPHMGASLRLADGLDVRWAAEDGVRAQTVVVLVDDHLGHVVSHTLGHDGGQHHIAPASLSPGAATLTVERAEKLTLSGAVAPSAIVSRYSVSTSIVRQ